MGQEIVLATWNVNSIRSRLELLTNWIRQQKPDIVCLQETKVRDNEFPWAVLQNLGYEIAVNGQAQVNGVAILSRLGLKEAQSGFSTSGVDEQARLVSAFIRGVRYICIYAPNAYSLSHPSFTYKKQWLDCLTRYVRELVAAGEEVVVCGDFNVAPRGSDAHDPKAWLYQTFVHSEVRVRIKELTDTGMRDLHSHCNGETIAYTWWDYRGKAFTLDRGLRIDHIYATPKVVAACQGVWVERKVRAADHPSDHAPVIARFISG